MKNNEYKPSSNRVLVYRIAAPSRPYLSFSDLLEMSRPHDWSVFGAEACRRETKRRMAIHELLTDDERDIFEKYCHLRDE